ncbi:hypothetical protein THAOC_37837 [Thalassiosira oceanica]|uniref:Uncharacterized protein n=1 Tax=Thalassiosira oceanica TaxID=159749 RepID=K0QY52_THAOC|nr:hypothetical protein THAOC_37837 [Thalassiosira oceanica]|eukprot:EJK43693.1 hypothetical protein THAOC_37837 [Thalassiosira oceanica]
MQKVGPRNSRVVHHRRVRLAPRPPLDPVRTEEHPQGHAVLAAQRHERTALAVGRERVDRREAESRRGGTERRDLVGQVPVRGGRAAPTAAGRGRPPRRRPGPLGRRLLPLGGRLLPPSGPVVDELPLPVALLAPRRLHRYDSLLLALGESQVEAHARQPRVRLCTRADEAEHLLEVVAPAEAHVGVEGEVVDVDVVPEDGPEEAGSGRKAGDVGRRGPAGRRPGQGRAGGGTLLVLEGEE